MDKKTHIFNRQILKQYDIRGVVDKEMNEVDAYFVGKSYATLLLRDKKKISCVVGYDGRHTSKLYAQKLIDGMLECGVDVINIGLCPTPMVYFAIHFLKVGAGMIITASHNPPEYNGFKMLTNEDPIFGDDIQKLGTIAEKGDFAVATKKAHYEEKNIKKDYVDFVISQLNKNNKKTLNIVWDAGNGAVASVLKDIVARVPGKHKTICDTVDGDFPNHHPDPAVSKYMDMLKKEVVDGGYDLGLGFDGDGDRVGMVDSEGYLFCGDEAEIILARDFLKTHPGEKIMNEVSASMILFDDIKQHGGIPVIWKTGHSTQKAKMKKDNIKLAAETSCHIYWGENHNFDDSLFSAMKIINVLSNSDETLAEMRHKFPKTYNTPKTYISCSNEDKERVPEEIAKRMKQEGREVIDVDGARVTCGDGWWLIRSSNTSPKMTVRCEALSEEGLEKCKAEVIEQAKLSGFELKF